MLISEIVGCSILILASLSFSLAQTNGKHEAIIEAEKLNLSENPFYYSLLGNLYTDVDNKKAIQNFEKALLITNSPADKAIIIKNINLIKN